MFAKLKAFFAKVDGSVKGVLLPEELYRSLLTALGSGTTVGTLILVLQAIISHASVIFPNPTVATLVTMLLTLVLDLLRRQSQGATPSPSPIPLPAPAPSIPTA